jgi:hypothetical protein
MSRTYRRPKSRRKLARIARRQMRRSVTFAFEAEPVTLSWESWQGTLASLGILVSGEAGR